MKANRVKIPLAAALHLDEAHIGKHLHLDGAGFVQKTDTTESDRSTDFGIGSASSDGLLSLPTTPLGEMLGTHVEQDLSQEADARCVQPLAYTVQAQMQSASPYPFLDFRPFATGGSALHYYGACKPCAFLYEGCMNGMDCQFCHLCPPGELKRRKRVKLAQKRRGFSSAALALPAALPPALPPAAPAALGWPVPAWH